MDDKNKKLVYTSMMAAMVCVATFIIKVPSVVTNGYVHIGDGVIFISVILLGGKSGAWAGAIGAALADLLGGYGYYVMPTFIIKGVMALIMGIIIKKLPNLKFKWIVGAAFGSIWQIAAYYLVGSLMVGSFISTLVEIPGNAIQSLVGIIETIIFMALFKNTDAGKKMLNKKS